MPEMITLVWFRRDLRLLDNPALNFALTTASSVLPVYVHAPEEDGEWRSGAASRWYLKKSLESLDADLRKRGSKMLFTAGPTLEKLCHIADSAGVTHIYWNAVHEPDVILRDQKLKLALEQRGFTVEIFQDQSLLTPGRVLNQSGLGYKVFTPFWRQFSGLLIDSPSDAPKTLPATLRRPKMEEPGVSLEQLGISHPAHWQASLDNHWRAGEAAAEEILDHLLDKIAAYPLQRDLPAQSGTSTLSAALHFGEISPAQIFSVLRPYWQGEAGPQVSAGTDAFLRQLAWREFAINTLLDNPHTVNASLNPRFNDSAIWSNDPSLTKSWQAGKTGYPLVDAGMNELWETGWMHNRVRMVAASFLTKNLGQHWLQGARWFWNTLVDADLANNTMGWQWVAGCGCDASPYYRIFNPERQAQRFDPKSEYISHWLDKTHQPRQKMVDLGVSRKQALARYHDATQAFTLDNQSP